MSTVYKHTAQRVDSVDGANPGTRLSFAVSLDKQGLLTP